MSIYNCECFWVVVWGHFLHSPPSYVPLELVKGLGIWDHNPAVDLLVAPNFQHVPDIAEELVEQLSTGQYRLPGFLIHNHGITAWGTDLSQTRNHIELFSYVFSFMCREY